MRFLLLNQPLIKEKADVFQVGSRHPRVGIASLATQLSRAKVEVKVVDPEFTGEKGLIELIRDFSPDWVGMGAYTEEICDAEKTAILIKSISPKTKVLVGGPHTSALPEETLKEFPSIDFIAVGEGESIILNIVEGKSFGQIPGLGFRINGDIVVNGIAPKVKNLEELVPLHWDLFHLEFYKGSQLATGFGKKGKSLDLPVEGARGCPFECNFCYRMNGREIRIKKPELVIEEIEYNVEKFGATSIYFTEGSYGVDRKSAIKVCEGLIERGLNKKIKWSTGGRVNLLDFELLKLMKEAGCFFLGIGVESGSQEILDREGKGIKIEQIINVFKWCNELGIKTEANFILGHPFETEETINQTIQLAKEIKADIANFAILVPFPGTETYKQAEKGYGGLRLLSKDWKLYGKQIGAAMDLIQLPREKLIKLQNKAYRSFYLTPRNFPKFLAKLNAKRIYNIFKRLIYS